MTGSSDRIQRLERVIETLKAVNEYLGRECPISKIIRIFSEEFVATEYQDGLVERGNALQEAIGQMEGDVSGC